MALHWRPLGPEPAETYWRRRALVASGLVLLLLLPVVLLTRGGGDPDRLAEDGPAAAPQASEPAATASTDPSASPSPSGPAVCAPSSLQLVTATDAESYPVGGRPVLELRASNTGPSVCTVDLGSDAVELLVFSGEDRIWSSDDCGSGGPAKPTALQPGTPVSTKITWTGRRSLPGCEGPKAQAQPGTYRVTGRVGSQPASGGSFRFTG